MRTLLVLLLSFLTLTPCLAETEPRAVVDGFYRSYLKQIGNSGNWLEALMQQESGSVEPQLRDLLLKLSQGEPGGDEPWLDFDPFSNSQVGSEGYTLGPTKRKGNLAYVPVNIRYPQVPGPARLAAHVVLRYTSGSWRIANLEYPARDGMASWDLLGYLKDGFKVP